MITLSYYQFKFLAFLDNIIIWTFVYIYQVVLVI